MPTPTIDRRAIWKRLMDRAAASQRTPTIHEPAGYEFNPAMSVDLVESLPQEAQTELALQLSKLVLDTSRVPKRREIPAPTPIDTAKARRGLTKLLKIGRYASRQGPAIAVAIREGALTMLPRDSLVAVVGGKLTTITREEAIIAPTCAHCDTLVKLPGEMHNVQGEMVCAICYENETRECPSCHTREFWHRMQRGPTEPVCRTCAERLMTSCPACGEPTPRGSVRNGTCPACVRSRFIHSYSHKPNPLFFLDPAAPTVHAPVAPVACMGVELETELPRSIRDCAAHAYEACRGIDDFIYAKHDGSLNYGVEYVSHPFSWAWVQGGGGARWSEFLAKLRETKHTSYDPGTCGMHVHVTRKFYQGDPLFRLLNLAQNCPQLFLQMSRRNESDLIQWANPRGGNPTQFRNIADGHANSPTKYTSINVTQKTIEFRLFRGTLNTTGFFANLEATKAMLDFCTSSAAAVTAPNFLEYVNARPATYPNFIGAILRSTAKV